MLVKSWYNIAAGGCQSHKKKGSIPTYIVYKTKPATRGCYSHSEFSYYTKNKWEKNWSGSLVQ